MNSRNSGLDEILARLRASEGYALIRAGVPEDKDLIGLDSNENYFADADLFRRMAEEAARCDLRFYPREEIIELREMLGAWLKVEPECIVLANGEDQLIDLAATVLLKEGSAITVSPTYSMYRLRVELVGGKVVQVPLRKDFSLDVPRLVSVADESRASVMFLCSPNNPTGNQFPETDIMEVLDRYTGLVIVDEAYADFADRSLVSLTRAYPNLAVAKTFSKAFGIAGARLGYMIANAELSKALTRKVQLPYPISRFTARLGIECLRNLEAMRDSVSKMKEERSWLTERLRRLGGLRVFDSEANFVLVSTGRDSSKISARLRLHGVSVKDLGDVLSYVGCLRVTVGTRSMNEKLLNALEEVMSDGQL
jgi:histidinol-phosphate aminotransferase